MKILTAIVCLSIFFSCTQKNQRIVDRYPNGQKKTEHFYSSKKDTSKYLIKVYYENGKLKHEAAVSANMFVGEKKSYYENGILERIETLNSPTPLDDSLYDCYIINYRPNGSKISEYQYSNNVLHGLRRDYDSLGNLERMADYSNGMINGKEIFYYPNGIIKELYFLKDDSLNGYEIHFKERGDTLKWFHNGEYGVNGMFYKKWLDYGALTGYHGDSNRTYVIWKWVDKSNKVIKTKIDKSKNGKYIAPE